MRGSMKYFLKMVAFPLCAVIFLQASQEVNNDRKLQQGNSFSSEKIKQENTQYNKHIVDKEPGAQTNIRSSSQIQEKCHKCIMTCCCCLLFCIPVPSTM